MSMTTYNAPVKPDAVYGKDNERPFEDWMALDPCPVCNARPHDAPEGIVQHTGDPVWTFPHCWKCGYRPGVNEAVSQDELRRQFETFKQWYEDDLRRQNVSNHPTLNPPNEDQVAVLQAQIRQLQDDLAGRTRPNEVPATTEQPAFRPDTSGSGVAAQPPSQQASGYDAGSPMSGGNS